MQRDSFNPSMVVLARESRGWTQHNLSAATEIAQSKVAKLELGVQAAKEEDVSRIACALDYEPSLFFVHEPIFSVASGILFRQRQVGVKLQRRVDADLNIRRLQVQRLLNAAQVESMEFPCLPLSQFADSPARVAQHLRSMWRLPDGPISNLTAFIEAFGGIIVPVEFGDNAFDAAHIWQPPYPPMFFMSTSTSGERYRFSLAHELGHAVMHRIGLHVEGDLESQADEFASELLMPKAIIKRDLAGFRLEHAFKLKQTWKVSISALIMRAFHLGTITDASRRRMITDLNMRGILRNEPFPILMEQPRSLQRLLDLHTKSLGFSQQDLRSLLFTLRPGPIDPIANVNLKVVGVSDDGQVVSRPVRRDLLPAARFMNQGASDSGESLLFK